VQAAQRLDGGAHAGASGETVIHEDDRCIFNVGGRAAVPVGALAAFELGLLAGGDAFNQM
jgi:hypothetical protein